MTDILRQKSFFPLKDFEDVVKLFEFNLDKNNGEPNLALLSIVAGLIEHSLVTVTDKDDLADNSRPVHHPKDLYQSRGLSSTNRLINSSSQHDHLSSTSNELNKHYNQQSQLGDAESNEAGYVSTGETDESGKSSPDLSALANLSIPEI